MRTSRTLAVSIGRRPHDVHAFVSDVGNLPRWAAGLDPTLRLRFAEANALGVADHWVTLPDGTELHVPVRVIANDDGSEVLFTLFDPAEGDVEAVAADLRTLKRVLEESAR